MSKQYIKNPGNLRNRSSIVAMLQSNSVPHFGYLKQRVRPFARSNEMRTMLRSLVERARRVAVFVAVHYRHESSDIQQSLKAAVYHKARRLQANMKVGI